ncbi:MAG: hypothetical protein ABW208_07100 [Pyrinomonadaceae bacterium]
MTKVPPGSTLNVDLRRKQKPKAQAPAAPDDDRGIIEAESIPTRYVFRDSGPLTFYDLGTRLRSVPPSTNFNDFSRTRTSEPPPVPDDDAGRVNEYLEIDFDGAAENLRRLIRTPYDEHTFDDYGLGSQHVQADIPAALQAEFDAACLGSLVEGSADPVSPLDKFKANGSERELPACAPVPYVPTVFERADYHEADGYPTEAFDFILYNEATTLKFPNTTFRESVRDLRKWANDEEDPTADIDVQAVFNGMEFLDDAERWKEREHKDGEGAERWNANNLAGGEAKRGAEHSQKGQGSGFNLKIDSRLIYEPFDTGDAENFKVTKEPSFEADEATLKLTGKPTRVFLRPQLLAFGRAEEFGAGATVSVETHTFWEDDSQTPWVHHKSENYSDNYAGGLFMDLSLFNVYDPAAAPLTFTVTVTKTPAGFGMVSATVSGTPTGDGSYTWSAGGAQTVAVAPGLEISIFFDSLIPNGTFMSYDIVPNWQPFSVNLSADAAIVRGMHVGRWPFLPRAGVGGWDSVLTFDGEGFYEYTDVYNGVHYVYDPAIAATLSGRAAFHNGTAAQMRQVYDRHASRDLNRLAYLPSVLTARAFFFDHPELGIDEATLLAIRGANFVGGLFGSAATADALTAQVEADAQAMAEAIAALGTFRNPTGTIIGSGISGEQLVYILPPFTVPAGVLCGIVEHGSAVFYVWRRTPETRGGYDGERNQGAFRYPSISPYV